MFSITPWKKRRETELAATRPETPDDLFAPISRFRNELDSLMKHFFPESVAEETLRRFEPNWMSNWLASHELDIKETEKEYVLQAEIPGFEPDEIEVKMTGDVLTIRAEHTEEKEGKEGERHYHSGRFFRSMTVPSGVRSDDIEARYHSGVLEIHLPKTQEARGKRITIQST